MPPNLNEPGLKPDSAASELIFNQTTVTKPDQQLVRLDEYLQQPNPYAPEFEKWLDVFNKEAYGFNNAAYPDGHLYWIPLNLFDAGLYYNTEAFAKAGVQTPLKTWKDWRAAVPKLKAAGYTPLAMDNSDIGIFWTSGAIWNMLLAKYYDQWNVYDVSGKPGKSNELTIKSIARAIKSGQLNAQLNEITEGLKLIKEWYDSATPNWSGIKGLSGSGVGLPDFISGKAAMAIGANFGAGDVAKAAFTVGSMPFPTITNATTPVSSNWPAQFGVSAGGTSYMIPATTKGDKLKYAIRFLQFMTAPKFAQPCITATSGVPSTLSVTPIPSIAGFSEGDWGKTPRQTYYIAGRDSSQQLLKDLNQILTGYILGTTGLEDTQNKLNAAWKASVDFQIKQNPDWAKEDWAK